MTGGYAVGQTLDRYRVERALGQGGMATVVRVRHTVLGTVHAMKVLHVMTPQLVDRLLREGRVQAALRHPNVVGVTDVVSLPHGVALILEYVDGPTLSELTGLVRLNMEEIDALADQLMLGVAAAHAQGVIHRDLKPNNVLMGRSPQGLTARITDFGLARALVEGADGSQPLTRSGVAMGTPGYMAPEQVRSARDIDERADVFALGAVLYELVTGRPAFDGVGMVSVYEQMMARRTPEVASLAPEVPERFAAAIHAALSPDPADRPQTVHAMRALWRDGTPEPVGPWRPALLTTVDQWLESRVVELTPPVDDRGTVALTPSPVVPGPATVDASALAPEVPPPPTTSRSSLVLLLLALTLALALSMGVRSLNQEGEARDAIRPQTPPPIMAPARQESPPPVEAEAVEVVEPPAPPAPPSPPPSRPARPGPAIVAVTGSDDVVLMDDASERHTPGAPLAAGSYRVMMKDSRGQYLQVLRLTLSAGQRVQVVCQPELTVCQVQ